MSSTPVVTPKNTKNEIYNAYKAALAEVKQVKATKLNPVEVKTKKRKAETAEKVKGLSVDSVAKSIETLENRATGFLGALRDEYSGELEKLEEVKQAIRDKEAELQEVFGIEREAESLAGLIQSQAEMREKFQQDMDTKRSTFEEEMATKRKTWNEEKAEYEKRIKRETEETMANRERELADAKYEFERQKKEQTDALNDELAAERKRFNEAKESKMKEIDTAREAFFKDRAVYAELEATYKALQQRVADFEKEKAEAIEAATAAAKASAQKSFGIEVNAIKKNYEADLKVKDGEIKYLQTTDARLRDQVEDLSKKLEQAYSRMQETAQAALNAQGNMNTVAQVQAAVASASASKK